MKHTNPLNPHQPPERQTRIFMPSNMLCPHTHIGSLEIIPADMEVMPSLMVTSVAPVFSTPTSSSSIISPIKKGVAWSHTIRHPQAALFKLFRYVHSKPCFACSIALMVQYLSGHTIIYVIDVFNFIESNQLWWAATFEEDCPNKSIRITLTIFSLLIHGGAWFVGVASAKFILPELWICENNL